MAYNPNYNGGQNRHGFSPYASQGQQGGYNRNWNQGFNPNPGRMFVPRQQSQKKHSGCKFGMTHVSDKPYVRGWKFDKTHGFRTFIAGPNKKTKRVQSENGKDWENWTVKVSFPNGTQLYNALYDVSKRRVYIQDLGLMMSPSGGAGGYVGPFFRRK